MDRTSGPVAFLQHNDFCPRQRCLHLDKPRFFFFFFADCLHASNPESDGNSRLGRASALAALSQTNYCWQGVILLLHIKLPQHPQSRELMSDAGLWSGGVDLFFGFRHVFCLVNSRAKLGHYHSCGDNHGIRPPNPEQYLTPLQQKEVAIRHLRTKLLESENTVHDRLVFMHYAFQTVKFALCTMSIVLIVLPNFVYSHVHGQSLFHLYFISLHVSTICIVYIFLLCWLEPC